MVSLWVIHLHVNWKRVRNISGTFTYINFHWLNFGRDRCGIGMVDPKKKSRYTPLLSNRPTLFDLPRLPYCLNNQLRVIHNSELWKCTMLSHIPDKLNRRFKCTASAHNQFMTKIRQSPGHLADEATKHVYLQREAYRHSKVYIF